MFINIEMRDRSGRDGYRRTECVLYFVNPEYTIHQQKLNENVRYRQTSISATEYLGSIHPQNTRTSIFFVLVWYIQYSVSN